MTAAALHALCCFLGWLSVSAAQSKVTEGPWLFNGEPVPESSIRVTTLGSGTPDVRKDQVSSGFLLELGNGDKFIWDLGTGSYQNLLATAVPAKLLTKVSVCYQSKYVWPPLSTNPASPHEHISNSLDPTTPTVAQHPQGLFAGRCL